MIRVLVVDDHPAVRAGLASLLRTEPGRLPVGAVGSAEQARPELARGTTDVLLVDYDLPDSDGLALCWDAKCREDPPAVLIYTAFARPRLTIAATLAGADAMLDKGAPPEHLFELVRIVAGGGKALPRVPPDLIRRCVAELDPDDIPLFGMAFNQIPVAEIASDRRPRPRDHPRPRARAHRPPSKGARGKSRLTPTCAYRCCCPTVAQAEVLR